MEDWSLGLGEVGVFNLCLLWAFFIYLEFLFLGLDFFLGFWFRLWVAYLWFFCDIVQIEQFLSCFSLTPEYFPQCLLFFQFLGIDFSRFHCNRSNIQHHSSLLYLQPQRLQLISMYRIIQISLINPTIFSNTLIICYYLSYLMRAAQKSGIQSLNIEILGQNEIRYKSRITMSLMGLVICISGVMFGYGLTEISTIPIKILTKEYHITIRSSLAQAILIGIMPFGGIFGALSFNLLLKWFRRRTSIFFISVWMVISTILMEINTEYTIFIGRFLEGVCIGLYVSVGPIYLREIVAKQLRGQLMSIFSLCKVLGIVLAYSIQYILQAANFAYSYRILLCLNGVLALIQTLLVFFFIPQSPIQMVQKNDYEQAKKVISILYNPQFKDQILKEMIRDDEVARAQKQASKIEDLSQSSGIDYTDNKRRALLLAIHVCILRQFIGGNVLVSFSNQIVQTYIENAKLTALILNLLQLASNASSLLYFSNRFGRRTLQLFGTFGLMIFNFGIAIALLYGSQDLILITMGLYMVIYGSTFLPASWSYPSQIIPANEATIPNICGWLCTSIVISVPPIVQAAMPDHSTYPLFFFFGVYGGFGFTVLYIWMVQSKGKTYKEILKDI